MTLPLVPSELAQLLNVSRETMDKYEVYLSLLRKWNTSINLVGQSTLDDPWRRHFLDSLQLVPFLPKEVRSVIDLGSGAGFPGLVLAACSGATFHLIESDKRKASFLRQTALAMKLPNVSVHAVRLDMVALPADVILARAFKSLPELLDQSRHIATSETRFLLLKGRNVDIELTDAALTWNMKTVKVDSLAGADGSVLLLDGVALKNVSS